MNETFPPMVNLIKSGTFGIAQIDHYQPSDLDLMLAAMNRQSGTAEPVVRLMINGRLVMSDSPYEKRTNYEFVRMARGNVLVAGLGIGMILVPVLKKPEVATVTVIEKYQDVINAVGLSFQDPKLTLINADIFEWKTKQKFDCIYFDIWPDICEDNLEDMAKLHQRFKSRKAVDGWMNSWCRDILKSRRRQSRSSVWR